MSRNGEIISMFCNEEGLGENMAEVVRLVEASMHCDTVDPWNQVAGTPPHWQTGK